MGLSGVAEQLGVFGERDGRNDGGIMLTSRLALCVVAGLVAGCSVGEDIGDEGIGVYVYNECVSTVLVEPGHTAEVAVERFASNPIRIETGRGSHSSVIANAASDPQAYFLAFGLEGAEPEVREFDIGRLRRELVEVTFGSDCATLADQAPEP